MSDLVKKLRYWSERDTVTSEYEPVEHIAGMAADRIEELAARMATAASDILRLNNDNRELQAQVDAIKPIADYANRQADMAQIRLLKQGDLYDDTYWQPVLDKIRFELLQIAAIKGVDDDKNSSK